LWVLVLVADDPASANEAHVWPQLGRLLAETSACSLKLSVRVTPWAQAWRALQRILLAHRPAASEWPWGDDAAAEETEHERLLQSCGLSAWAARKVVRQHTLRSFLALSPQTRADYFKWLPEAQRQQLAAFEDGGGRRHGPGVGAPAPWPSSAPPPSARGPHPVHAHVPRAEPPHPPSRDTLHPPLASGVVHAHAPPHGRGDAQDESQALRRRRLGFTGQADSSGQTHLCWNAAADSSAPVQQARPAAARGHRASRPPQAGGAHKKRRWGDR